jgi:hypothetical protein
VIQKSCVITRCDRPAASDTPFNNAKFRGRARHAEAPGHERYATRFIGGLNNINLKG